MKYFLASSITDIFSSSNVMSCGMYPIFTFDPIFISGLPFIISFIKVDFPAPFGPIIHTFSWYLIKAFVFFNNCLFPICRLNISNDKISFPLLCSTLKFKLMESLFFGLSNTSIFSNLFSMDAALRKNFSPTG